MRLIELIVAIVVAWWIIQTINKSQNPPKDPK